MVRRLPADVSRLGDRIDHAASVLVKIDIGLAVKGWAGQ